MPRLEVLICEEGGHEWTRLSVRGRKPRFCPKHTFSSERSSAPSVEFKSPRPTIETLICTVGNHEWTRPPTRGRKPTVCPAHASPKVSVSKTTVQTPVASVESTHVLQKKSPKNHVTSLMRLDLDNPALIHVLNEEPGSELHRKLTYVIGEFRHPRANREPGDWRLLHYSFDRLMEEAGRSYRGLSVNQTVEAAL